MLPCMALSLANRSRFAECDSCFSRSGQQGRTIAGTLMSVLCALHPGHAFKNVNWSPGWRKEPAQNSSLFSPPERVSKAR